MYLLLLFKYLLYPNFIYFQFVCSYTKDSPIFRSKCLINAIKSMKNNIILVPHPTRWLLFARNIIYTNYKVKKLIKILKADILFL